MHQQKHILRAFPAPEFKTLGSHFQVKHSEETFYYTVTQFILESSHENRSHEKHHFNYLPERSLLDFYFLFKNFDSFEIGIYLKNKNASSLRLQGNILAGRQCQGPTTPFKIIQVP